MCEPVAVYNWGSTSICELQLKISELSWRCSVQIMYPLKNALFVILIVNSFYLFCNLPCTFKKYLLMQKSLLFTIFVQLHETPARWLLLIVIDLVLSADVSQRCWTENIALIYRMYERSYISVKKRTTEEYYYSRQQNFVFCTVRKNKRTKTVGILVDNCTHTFHSANQSGSCTTL